MADQLPPCPECGSEYAYATGELLTCPMCAHEWLPAEEADAPESASGSEEAAEIRDAVGEVLLDGDTVTIVKGLKVKGGGSLKAGTKVRGIRLAPGGPDGHDLEAKIPGVGQMLLKSSVVKKAT